MRPTRVTRSERTGQRLTGAALAMVGGVYLAFPAALAVLATIRRRPIVTRTPGPRSVTILIAAHNEAADIGRKLDCIAGLRRPVQVIVASDGSLDTTVEVARRHPSRPTVLDLPRGGKAAALNAGLAHADGEVVVFTDANSRFDDHAFEQLLAPFRDPEVGGVAGDQRYDAGETGTATGEGDYWSYERQLKRWESACGSVVSSTGTLHAVRRDLVDTVPDDVTDDFYISTGVIANGSRLVFAPGAVAWETPSDEAAAGYRRRVRIVTRGLTGVARRRRLFDVRRFGLYSVVLAVHKVARRLLFVPMLGALVGAWLVRRRPGLWRVLVAGQFAFYAASAVGLLAPRRIGRMRPFALPAHFLLANVAAAHAVFNVCRGRRFVTWDPERR